MQQKMSFGGSFCSSRAVLSTACGLQADSMWLAKAKESVNVLPAKVYCKHVKMQF